MTAFQTKLDKILRENNTTVILKEDSSTSVHPEKGEDVTHRTIDGTGKIDATGPVSHTGDSTLKTTPGVSPTDGPTGHLPVNSDLPRSQNDGLGTSNDSPGKKAYGLTEEGKDKDKKEVEEGKLPAFLKKKDVEEGKETTDSRDNTKDDTDSENERAGFKVRKEETDSEEGDKTKNKMVDEETAKEDEKEDEKAVKEATELLFAGEKLTEVFKEKTTTIFESTLSLRLKENRKKLNDRFTKKLNERVEEIRGELAESVNGHLDLVVENWIQSNEVPLEKALKAELVEDFIGKLKNLWEEHYFEIPEDKVDIVTEMADRISKMESKLNEQLELNVSLTKQNKLFERTEVLSRVSKGLATTQSEKLKSLAESVEFKNAKQFEKSLETLKESLNNTSGSAKKPTPINLAEQTLSQPALNSDLGSTPMGAITEAMARMAKI